MASSPSSSSPTPELSRELSLFHVTMMGLGMMIGAGVFWGMGISIGEAGPGGVVLTFALNGLLAMLTAMSFAELSSAIPRAGGAVDFEQFLQNNAKKFDIPRQHLKTKTVKAKAIVKAILKEAKDDDLVVLGTTEKPLLAQMGRMSLPEKIPCRTPKPVVMVKSDVGVRSWIRRWI